MEPQPYFRVTQDSFEKNAGYKTTCHALAELIDNSYEADATQVAVVLMVDREKNLRKIGIVDDGIGMTPEVLQLAICEKSGQYLDRKRGGGPPSRKKLAKYGVGLPKGSISQCNQFSVWSWTSGGPKKAFKNGINTTDQKWIDAGAKVPESKKSPLPKGWLDAAGLAKAKNGTFILWEDLDGITWKKARWGSQGLIPNLEREVGRVYRKLFGKDDSEFNVTVFVINEQFDVEETIEISGNDPLYLTPGQKIPRHSMPEGKFWPPDDPLFDEVTDQLEAECFLEIEIPNANKEKLRVEWRASAARHDVFAQFNGADAGKLPHGKHTAHNVGLSILREEREITMSLALCNPSEPRERWFGVEVMIPHELDRYLGMTNNKQEYTRFETILKHEKNEYKLQDESTEKCFDRIEREDFATAVCLRIAWRTQAIWSETRNMHLRMRQENHNSSSTEDDTPASTGPEEQAEDAASKAFPKDSTPPANEEEKGKLKDEFVTALTEAGLPKQEAKQLSERIVDRGLSFTILEVSNLGSPIFNIRKIKGTRMIELNMEHPLFPFLKSNVYETDSNDPETLSIKLKESRLATLFLLEAWGKLEADAEGEELRSFMRNREDWGRAAEKIVSIYNKDP